MDIYKDQQFEHAIVKLDESAFYRCRFVDCLLLYGGGDVIFEESQIERCQIRFYGPAARTLNIVPFFGWSLSQPSIKSESQKSEPERIPIPEYIEAEYKKLEEIGWIT